MVVWDAGIMLGAGTEEEVAPEAGVVEAGEEVDEASRNNKQWKADKSMFGIAGLLESDACHQKHGASRGLSTLPYVTKAYSTRASHHMKRKGYEVALEVSLVEQMDAFNS